MNNQPERLSVSIAYSDVTEVESLLVSLQKEIRGRLGSNPRASQEWLRGTAHELLRLKSQEAVLLQVENLILLAEWFEDGVDRTFALQLLEHARDIASRAKAPSAERRVLNTLGSIHTHAKNIPAALVCYAAAFELSEQIGDRIGRCAVLANMSTLRFNMGMLDEAVKLASFVIELCGSETVLLPIKSQAHQSIAEATLAMSDPETACLHAAAALNGFAQPGTRVEATKRVLVEATLVRALVAAGRIHEALRHNAAAAIYASEAETHTARVQAELSMALCDAAQGKCDIALTRLALLEERVKPTDLSFRDLVQIELFSNAQAGRKKYADYYNKKYLFSLSEFQRKSAIEQVAALKRLLKQAERRDTWGPSRPTVVSLFSAHLEALAALAELREDASGEHAFRVGVVARNIAESIGYSDRDASMLEQAARLHDIGKLATPDAILLKRGRLSQAEREIIQRHCTEGSQILADLLFTVEATEIREANEIGDGLRLAAEIAQFHHECWNGSGYPRGIAGSTIPEPARIVAIADAFDELVHVRPYKKPLSHATSLKQIEAASGLQFDPKLCRDFSRMSASKLAVPARDESQLSQFAAADRVIKRILSAAR